MIIKYCFLDGEVSEVEVSEDIGTVIEESRREENSAARQYRRYCYSSDAIKYGDCDIYAPRIDFDDSFMDEDECDKRLEDILATFNTLTETQFRRLKKHMSGMTVREIAAEEGVHHSVIEESIRGARKKFQTFLK